MRALKAENASLKERNFPYKSMRSIELEITGEASALRAGPKLRRWPDSESDAASLSGAARPGPVRQAGHGDRDDRDSASLCPGPLRHGPRPEPVPLRLDFQLLLNSDSESESDVTLTGRPA